MKHEGGTVKCRTSFLLISALVLCGPVVQFATIWWANGLSSPPGHANPIRHGVAQQRPDERVQQITHNLFQRMIG